MFKYKQTSLHKMSVRVEVVPKDFIKTYNVNNVEVLVTGLKLGTQVELIALLKSGIEVVESRRITISGEEYDNWGQSDEYLINLVLSKVGLERKE